MKWSSLNLLLEFGTTIILADGVPSVPMRIRFFDPLPAPSPSKADADPPSAKPLPKIP